MSAVKSSRHRAIHQNPTDVSNLAQRAFAWPADNDSSSRDGCRFKPETVLSSSLRMDCWTRTYRGHGYTSVWLYLCVAILLCGYTSVRRYLCVAIPLWLYLCVAIPLWLYLCVAIPLWRYTSVAIPLSGFTSVWLYLCGYASV